ncbi:MAG: hypothetical protein AAGE03_00390 [Pseudomonadota bacterium]
MRIGLVHPETGPLGAVAGGNGFVFANARAALANGITVEGGATRAVEIIAKDSQSRSNRASEMAVDLILDDEVDIICAGIHPLAVSPFSKPALAGVTRRITLKASGSLYQFSGSMRGRDAAGTTRPNGCPSIPSNGPHHQTVGSKTEGSCEASPRP